MPPRHNECLYLTGRRRQSHDDGVSVAINRGEGEIDRNHLSSVNDWIFVTAFAYVLIGFSDVSDAIGVLNFGRKTNFPYRRKVTKIPCQKDILIDGFDRENTSGEDRPSGHNDNFS